MPVKNNQNGTFLRKDDPREQRNVGIGYQQSQASIMNNHSGLSGSLVEHLICKECGSIVHSKVNKPEIFKSNK